LGLNSIARDAGTALAVAAGYVACAVIGTVLSVPPSGFAIIWPATAFLISVMMLLPARRWWLCVVGVVPAHVLMAAELQPLAPPIVVTTQVAGNLLLAVATVFALHAGLGTSRPFRSFRSMVVFIALAALAVPAIVDALVLGVHVATGWASDFWLSWWQWMVAMIFPTVTIPPLIVLGWRRELTGRPPASPRAAQELALLVALLFSLTFVAFGKGVDFASWPALLLTPFPFLLWAAVRLGIGGTCAALLTTAAAIIADALRHVGPFSAHSPIGDVISLQIFLIAISIPLILLAAMVDERRRTASLLQQSEERMEMTAAATDTGLWQWDVRARELGLCGHCRAMFDVGEAASPDDFLATVLPEDRARVGGMISSALSSRQGRASDEFRIRRGEEIRWVSLLTDTELDGAGAPIRVSGVFRDVTERVSAEREAGRLRLLLLRLQDDERRRIAEELHDSTAQHLVAADLNLINLKTRATAGTQELLADIMKSVSEALAEIRTFSFLLHPPQLSEAGLKKVLSQYVPGFERRTGIRTTLRVSPIVDDLPTEQQHALLRITQESLGNVHRHADATRVSVSLRLVSGVVHLIVRDDGRGIPEDTGQQLGDRLRLGVGIPAMRARVRQMGGRIDVSSRAKGTTIHVAIPFPGEVIDDQSAAGPSIGALGSF